MKLYIMGNLGIRMPDVPHMKGDVVQGHTHNFDHMTYVPRGSFLVEVLGDDGVAVLQSKEVRASDRYNFVLIKKDRCHRLTALEDNSEYHCVYSHRDAVTGEPVDTYQGNEAAYV